MRRLPCLILLATVAAAVDDDPGYPRWRGADGSGGVDQGTALVGSWDDARFAWRSQHRNPMPFMYKVGRGWPPVGFGNGGFGNPVVAGGRVYFAHWRPAGEVRGEHLERDFGRTYPRPRHPGEDLVDADDVVVCIDARTGRTVWERVFAGKGFNWSRRNFGGHNTPCLHDGRLYVLGSAGRAYCVDADDGEVVWDVGLGEYAERYARYKALCLRDAILPVMGIPDEWHKQGIPEGVPENPHHNDYGHRGSLNSKTWNSAPVVAEGTVVFGDPWGRAFGLDADTGRERWRLKGALRNPNSPAIWRHGDRTYLLLPAGDVRCVDPRSGEELWRAHAGVGGYDSHGLAVKDDVLVAIGERKKEGYRCYRMTPDGAELLWELPLWARGGYCSPVIHRGTVWILCKMRGAPDGVAAGEAPGTWRAEGYDEDLPPHTFIAGVDLERGEIVGHFDVAPKSMIGSFVAMDGRLICQSAQARRHGGTRSGLLMYDLERGEYLGALGVPYLYCQTPAVDRGFVYYRDPQGVLACVDLRADPAAEDRDGSAPDPARAHFVVDLPGILRDGRAARLHLRTDDGAVVQSWVTSAPRFNVAEFTFHEDLVLVGDRLRGEVRMVVDGIDYVLHCDWRIVDGVLKGSCVDPFAGDEVEGLVVGSARAAAARADGASNGTARIVLRREWNGGSNRHAEGGMDFVLEDGAITDLRLSPFIGSPDSWSAEIHGHTLELRDGRLTGTIDVSVSTGPAGNYMPEGRYELRFDNPVVHNLVRGSFTAARDGGRPTTHTIPFGRIEVNAGDPVDPANAVYVIRLERALLGNGEPKTMELHLTAEDGRFAEPGIARGLGFNRGDFPVDASDLRVTDDGRLVGELDLDVVSDGWVPRADLPSSYSVDARVDGPAVDGTHEGTFGIREPKRVEVTGAIAGE